MGVHEDSACSLTGSAENRSLQPAIFLDRDGVLNRAYECAGVTRPPATLEELEILPGVAEALERLTAAGFPLVVVTNQPDVARGVQSRARVEEINERIRATLPLLDVLTCYHDTADGCGCRKPRPGLLLQAAKRWRFDLARSFIVGDRWSDVVAGHSAGCRAVLIATPWSGAHRCRPDHCARDLVEAAAWILRVEGGPL